MVCTLNSFQQVTVGSMAAREVFAEVAVVVEGRKHTMVVVAEDRKHTVLEKAALVGRRNMATVLEKATARRVDSIALDSVGAACPRHTRAIQKALKPASAVVDWRSTGPRHPSTVVWRRKRPSQRSQGIYRALGQANGTGSSAGSASAAAAGAQSAVPGASACRQHTVPSADARTRCAGIVQGVDASPARHG